MIGGKKVLDRRKLYADIINDFALEISISNYWRRRILNNQYNEILEISYNDEAMLPEYIRYEVVENKLAFIVSKVEDDKGQFDKNLVVFQFKSK